MLVAGHSQPCLRASRCWRISMGMSTMGLAGRAITSTLLMNCLGHTNQPPGLERVHPSLAECPGPLCLQPMSRASRPTKAKQKVLRLDFCALKRAHKNLGSGLQVIVGLH
jgi:hypothetical protein